MLLEKDLKKIPIRKKCVKNNHNNNKNKKLKNKRCLAVKYQNGNFKVCNLEEVQELLINKPVIKEVIMEVMVEEVHQLLNQHNLKKNKMVVFLVNSAVESSMKMQQQDTQHFVRLNLKKNNLKQEVSQHQWQKDMLKWVTEEDEILE